MNARVALLLGFVVRNSFTSDVHGYVDLRQSSIRDSLALIRLFQRGGCIVGLHQHYIDQLKQTVSLELIFNTLPLSFFASRQLER